MTVRWTLTYPSTGESWEMTINPNKMASPHESKNLSFGRGSRGIQRPATFKVPSGVVNWEWSGVINSKEHYDSLLEWSKKSDEVHVTDHFGRTFEVLIQKFAPEDRRPTGTKPWRLTYTMQAMILRRVS